MIVVESEYMEKNKVITIGGGIAGIELSGILAEMGHQVTVIEKEDKVGGKVNQYDHLFPDMVPASKITEYILKKSLHEKITIVTNTEIEGIDRKDGKIFVKSSDNREFEADALAVASGFDFFKAERKEEYGYHIYENVITSVDLEQIMKNGKKIITRNGKTPKRIAFIHCVGSRDEKSGNNYCSKLCCITGVKQATELKQLIPDAEIYCFYMDLRMVGLDHEKIYRTAQEKYDILFVRGRLSEASENIDESLLIKAEDTLSGRPIKMNVDLLVLLVGMEPGVGTHNLGKMCQLEFEENGFLKVKGNHLERNESSQKGIFLAGSCTRPMSIDETVENARSAALLIHKYLQNGN
jgi:heterodisulfide reductase subunit A